MSGFLGLRSESEIELVNKAKDKRIAGKWYWVRKEDEWFVAIFTAMGRWITWYGRIYEDCDIVEYQEIPSPKTRQEIIQEIQKEVFCNKGRKL